MVGSIVESNILQIIIALLASILVHRRLEKGHDNCAPYSRARLSRVNDFSLDTHMILFQESLTRALGETSILSLARQRTAASRVSLHFQNSMYCYSEPSNR